MEPTDNELDEIEQEQGHQNKWAHESYMRFRLHPADDFTELSAAIRWALDDMEWDPDNRPPFHTGRLQDIEELVGWIQKWARCPPYHILDHEQKFSAAYPNERSRWQTQFNYRKVKPW
jgi:hypothetical protein